MGKDSNLRTRERADLQSAAINHSATHPSRPYPSKAEPASVRNLPLIVNAGRAILSVPLIPREQGGDLDVEGGGDLVEKDQAGILAAVFDFG